MAAILFDTLQLARELREAGFSDEQAEGTAKALARGMSSDVATKSDLDVLRADLRREIASATSELKGDIATLRSATAAWIITAVLVNTVALIGVVGVLYGLLRPVVGR